MKCTAVVEGKPELVVVFGPDPYPVRLAYDVHLPGFRRKLDGVSERAEPPHHLGVGARGGKPCLLLHRVAIPVVRHYVIRYHRAERRDCGQDRNLEETSKKAHTATLPRDSRSLYHCD